jgi:hypothetical protein
MENSVTGFEEIEESEMSPGCNRKYWTRDFIFNSDPFPFLP